MHWDTVGLFLLALCGVTLCVAEEGHAHGESAVEEIFEEFGTAEKLNSSQFDSFIDEFIRLPHDREDVNATAMFHEFDLNGNANVNETEFEHGIWDLLSTVEPLTCTSQIIVTAYGRKWLCNTSRPFVEAAAHEEEHDPCEEAAEEDPHAGHDHRRRTADDDDDDGHDHDHGRRNVKSKPVVRAEDDHAGHDHGEEAEAGTGSAEPKLLFGSTELHCTAVPDSFTAKCDSHAGHAHGDDDHGDHADEAADEAAGEEDPHAGHDHGRRRSKFVTREADDHDDHEDEDSHGEEEDLEGEKIGYTFLILACGLVGGMLPQIFKPPQRYLGWANAFSGGVFMSTGINILPESTAKYKISECKLDVYGASVTFLAERDAYPVIAVCVMAGYALVLLVEKIAFVEMGMHKTMHGEGPVFSPRKDNIAHLVPGDSQNPTVSVGPISPADASLAPPGTEMAPIATQPMPGQLTTQPMPGIQGPAPVANSFNPAQGMMLQDVNAMQPVPPGQQWNFQQTPQGVAQFGGQQQAPGVPVGVAMAPGAPPAAPGAPPAAPALNPRLQGARPQPLALEADATKPESSVQTELAPYLLLAALGLHSVFAGIAFGVTGEREEMVSLLIAITSHKAVAALALGNSFLENKVPRIKAIPLIVFFSCLTPIGIGIGMAVKEANVNEVAAVLEGLATGTFIYVGMSEVVPHEFGHEAKGLREFPMDRFIKFGLLVLGVAAIALVGLQSHEH